jgi:hypothetical protein
MTDNVNVGFGPKERSREDILRILGNGDAKEVEAEKVEEA